jgi:hypothetical protein
MKALLIHLSALFSTVALAATFDDFSPNRDCTGTECTPFINSRPGISVSYVNPYFSGQVIVTVNGITYRGPAVFTSTVILEDARHIRQLWHYDNDTLMAPDGSTLLLTLDVYRDSPLLARGHDGRGATYTLLSGTVTLP